MEIGLGGSQIETLRGGDDADVDGSSAGLRDEGVENFVIVDEEVDMEPKGIS